MKDWNVIVTVTDRFAYRHARRRLRQFGTIESTPFHNVLVMQVADVGVLLAALAQMLHEDVSLLNDISRLVPAQVTFDFETKEEFERQASAVILDRASRLAGGTFHIRLHRRRPGRTNFDDPDHVIDIETVGNRAGLSLWSRDDLRRYSFLRVD